MKRIVTVLLAICLCAGMAACGGRDDPSSAAGEPVSAPESSSTESTPESSTESASSAAGQESPAAGSMTIGEAIAENLRADDGLKVYMRDDGSVYFIHSYNTAVPQFFKGALDGNHMAEVKNIGRVDDEHTLVQAVTEDGEAWFGENRIFEGFDMERVKYVDGNVFYGITTDGRVAVDNRNAKRQEDWFVREVPQFSGAKYIYYFAGCIATVNADGTVTMYELADNRTLLSEYEQETGYSYEHKWGDIPEEASAWTDIAWMTMGYDDRSDEYFAAGLKNDGTVVATSACSAGLSGWTDMVYIGCSERKLYGLTSDGSVRVELLYGEPGEYELPEAANWTGVKVLRLENSKDGSAITFDNRLLGDAAHLVYRVKPGETDLSGWEISGSSEAAKALVVEGAEGSGIDLNVDHLVP